MKGMDAVKAFPVYSDFSHMKANGGLDGVQFAVGLREENPEEMIFKVFPMTKIVPVPQKEKVVKKKEKKKEEPKECTRPDCAARKEKLVDLNNENKDLRIKLKLLQDKIETTRNKIVLTEKSVLMAEEKNDVLSGQIEDVQSRIQSTEADVAKTEQFNVTLRHQLEVINEEIASLRTSTDTNKAKIREIVDRKAERNVVFSSRSDPRFQNPALATEVSHLQFPNTDDDDGEESD